MKKILYSLASVKLASHAPIQVAVRARATEASRYYSKRTLSRWWRWWVAPWSWLSSRRSARCGGWGPGSGWRCRGWRWWRGAWWGRARPPSGCLPWRRPRPPRHARHPTTRRTTSLLPAATPHQISQWIAGENRWLILFVGLHLNYK